MTAAPASLPVRPGEDPWTDAEVAEVRTELEAEAAALREEIGQAEYEIAERDSVSQAGDDEADASSKLAQREHELALTQNTRELLDQTEHALARIDAGTYGECESCGKPIGKARLQAFPRATLCVECKQRQERR
jgi:DnaK suppressor protein